MVDLAEDEVDHAIDDRFLVGDVVVDRHRLDVELGCELADGEALDADLVGEIDCAGETRARVEGFAVGRVFVEGVIGLFPEFSLLIVLSTLR